MDQEMNTNDVQAVPETLESVLGTAVEADQIRIIEKLAQMSQAPILAMTVMLDTRNGSISLMLNGEYKYDVVYNLLDMTRKELNLREREELLKKPE